jgi:GcrA cell cycle regulator
MRFPSEAIASPWTPEREARAVRLFMVEGLTAAEVAEALGCGVSRAAVVGKIRRLGFLKREARRRHAPAAPNVGRPRIERRLPPQRPPLPMPPLREAPPTGLPRRLPCLAEDMCRWPIDDPGPGRMHATLFCAGRVEAGSYCPVHRALASRR